METTGQKSADRPRRTREASDMGQMVGRVLRSLVKRAEQGDMDALETLVAVQDYAAIEARRAARALRGEEWGYSWSDIGNALGITKQAAQQRFGG